MSYFSNFGMIGFIILFGHFKDIKYKIVTGIGALLTGLGVIISNSRGPVVAAVILLIGLFIRERKNYRVYLGALLVAIVVLSAVPSEHTTRITRFFDILGTGETTPLKSDVRYHLFMAGIEMIKKNPVTGIGAFNYSRYYHEEYAPKHGSRPGKWTPHNGYLQAFAELGVFGVIFFLGYLVTTAVFVYRSDKIFTAYKERTYELYNKIIGFWFINFCVGGFFSEMMISRNFYILPAIAAVLYSIAKRVERQNKAIPGKE
ncbi:MAG: O-antigen ligase family protein [bacterium]|nr:O-antigen ligase family protein [bacterium]